MLRRKHGAGEVLESPTQNLPPAHPSPSLSSSPHLWAELHWSLGKSLVGPLALSHLDRCRGDPGQHRHLLKAAVPRWARLAPSLSPLMVLRHQELPGARPPDAAHLAAWRGHSR